MVSWTQPVQRLRLSYCRILAGNYKWWSPVPWLDHEETEAPVDNTWFTEPLQKPDTASSWTFSSIVFGNWNADENRAPTTENATALRKTPETLSSDVHLNETDHEYEPTFFESVGALMSRLFEWLFAEPAVDKAEESRFNSRVMEKEEDSGKRGNMASKLAYLWSWWPIWNTMEDENVDKRHEVVAQCLPISERSRSSARSTSVVRYCRDSSSADINEPEKGNRTCPSNITFDVCNVPDTSQRRKVYWQKGTTSSFSSAVVNAKGEPRRQTAMQVVSRIFSS
jgi:hypothetical protein